MQLVRLCQDCPPVHSLLSAPANQWGFPPCPSLSSFLQDQREVPTAESDQPCSHMSIRLECKVQFRLMFKSSHSLSHSIFLTLSPMIPFINLGSCFSYNILMFFLCNFCAPLSLLSSLLGGIPFVSFSSSASPQHNYPSF